MPIYDFKCFKCNTVLLDRFHKPTSEIPLCDSCGETMKVLPSRVGIVYSGPGFHTNDYRKEQ